MSNKIVKYDKEMTNEESEDEKDEEDEIIKGIEDQVKDVWEKMRI